MEKKITVKNDNEKIVLQGKEIIENNEFFKDLSNIMENEEFTNFFDKYLNNWMDVRCIVIYMKLYSEFKEKYKLINNKELDKEVIVFLLKKIMADKDLRAFSIKTIEKKYDARRVDFFKDLKKFLKNKNMLLEF